MTRKDWQRFYDSRAMLEAGGMGRMAIVRVIAWAYWRLTVTTAQLYVLKMKMLLLTGEWIQSKR